MLPTTEEVRVCTSSACGKYYTKFDQELSAFIEVLTAWSPTRTYKQRKKPVNNSQKWSRSLTGWSLTSAFHYRVKVTVQTGVSKCWS